MLIRLEKRAQDNIVLFEDHIQALDHVAGRALITGHHDCPPRLYMDDLGSYEAFLKEKLAIIPGIAEIQSNIHISGIKRQTTFPLR